MSEAWQCQQIPCMIQHINIMYFLISCDFNLYLISCLPQHREDVQLEDVQFDPCFQYFVNSLSTISSVSQRHAVAEGEHLGSFTTRAAWFTQCCVRWTEATSAWATASHRTFPGWGRVGSHWKGLEVEGDGFRNGKSWPLNMFFLLISGVHRRLCGFQWLFEFHILLPQSSPNFQEQCRETKGAPRLSLAQAEEPEKAASFTVLDGLKGCEVALTAMDRRVTNLEDCLEDIGSDLAWWLRWYWSCMSLLNLYNIYIYSEVCEIGEVVCDIKSWKNGEGMWGCILGSK